MSTSLSSIRIEATPWALAAWAVLGGASLSDEAPPAAKLAPNAFTPSQTCGQCHKDIHAMWSSSMHAASFRDPLFQVEFMQGVFAGGDSLREVCLRCHAPTTRHTKDYRAQNVLTQEGITCDFCHSVSGIKKEGARHALLVDMGGDKRGPTPGLTSPAHGIQHLPLFQQAEFCADCHELANPQGVAVMTTFSEWKEGPYPAEGKTCQSCHMPSVPGARVAPELRASTGKTNLHALPGGKSLAQLYKAVTVEVADIRPSERKLWVKVRVTNSGSGHAIPTGHPMRRLVLEATLFKDNDLVSKRTKTYQRVLADAQGKLLDSKHQAYLRAARILSDNRLRPRQTDEAMFDFPYSGPGAFFVEAKVFYQYEPLTLEPHPMQVEMARDRKAVSP